MMHSHSPSGLLFIPAQAGIYRCLRGSILPEWEGLRDAQIVTAFVLITFSLPLSLLVWLLSSLFQPFLSGRAFPPPVYFLRSYRRN
jgi:hypothetical protein